MAAPEPSPLVIKKTQEILGKYVKKPPLTDKCLKKPPFKFLHDVINVIIKDTGFLADLYTTDELNSENITDKDGKINFLQKLIDTVKLTTKENLKVRPSKIVAGHEAERTNELLQAIGRALDKKLSSAEAVVAIKSGNLDTITKPPVSKTTMANKKPLSDKLQTKKSDPAKSNKPSVEKKEKPSDKKIMPKKVPEKNASKVKDKPIVTKSNSIEKPSIVKDKPATLETKLNVTNNTVPIENSQSAAVESKTDEPTEKPKILNGLSETTNNALGEPITNNDVKVQEIKPTEIVPATQIKTIPTSFSAELVDIIDQEAEIRQKERLEKKSAKYREKRKSIDESSKIEEPSQNDAEGRKGSSKLKTEKNLENFDKQKEPMIAEPAPPKPAELIRNKSFIIQPKDADARPRTSLRPPSVRPASARPGAPRRRDKNIEIILQPDETVKMNGINVKVEGINVDLDDDGENLVIIEDSTVEQSDILNGKNLSNKENVQDNDGQQGHLVQQILETQKEFLKTDTDISGVDAERKTDIEWDSAALRQRQSSAKQMDTLRESIQKLTRSVNPLGKLMDFLQEDIDSMQMELSQWQTVYANTKVHLNRERGLTETAIEPLKHELAQIEANIKEHIEMTNNCRVSILQNEEKIFKMLSDL